MVARLRNEYDTWFEDVSSTRKDLGTPPPIHIGAKAAPTVVLTRQDWKRIGSKGSWGGRMMGYWRVDVVRTGPFTVRAVALKGSRSKRVVMRLGDSEWDAKSEGRIHVFENVILPTGIGHLQVFFEDDSGPIGAYQVLVEVP